MSRPAGSLALALLGLALLAGGLLRLDGVVERPLYGDEHHTLRLADEGYGTILTTFDATGSHVVLPLLQRLALDLLGTGPGVFRLPALVPGLLMLLLAFPLLRPFVGRTPAVLATLALAASPMHVYYSGFARGYALAMLLGVALAHAVLRALRDAEGRRWWGIAALLAALTPYTHLSSAGYVACLGVVAVVLAGRAEGPGFSLRRAVPALVAFGGAALLCLALFAPLLGQVRHYLVEVQAVKDAPRSLVGMAFLLFGGRAPALVALVALPFCALGLARRDRTAFLVAATTLVGPVAALLVTRPHGMEYAYARYLLSALPFLLAWLAWGGWVLARRFARDDAAARRVALLGGALVVVLAYLTGPLGPGVRRGEPFGNSYLAMYRLPAFDVPHPDPPPVYAELAADPTVRRIVELPAIYTRATLLYRSYALLHGKPVALGFGEMPRGMRGAPYVGLQELRPGDALVLHRDPAREVRAYFRHVHEVEVPRLVRWGEEGFYERHRAMFTGNLQPRETMDAIAAGLRNRLGPADYKEDRVLVWKLAP